MKKFLLPLFLLITSNCFAFTFPTTSVLFSGTGSNSSLNSGNFSQYGSSYLKVISNQIVAWNTSTYSGSYWNVHTWNSPFTEVYATVNAIGGSSGDTVWLQDNFTTGSGNGYELQYYHNPTFIDSLTIQKSTGYSLGQLGSTILQNISVGDSLGLADWNGIIYLLYQPNGGIWKVLETVADSTYTSGRVGMEILYSSTSPGLINFGGGNSIMTPVAAAPYICSTNYYIATTGNDSNNGTASGTPWLTTAHALTTLAGISSNQSGTCIHYASGTYNEYVYDNVIGGTSATTSGYLAFKCDVPQNCIEQLPPAYASDPTFAGNFRFFGENYVVVDGFGMQGNPTTYTFTTSAATTSNAATYTYNGSTYTVTTSISGGTTLVTTATNPNFTLPASGTLVKVTCPNGSCDTNIVFSAEVGANDVGVGTGTYFQTPPTSHITVINSVIGNHGGAGVGVNNMDYLTVNGNVVYNNAWASQYQVSGVSNYEPVQSDALSGYHNFIENNLIFNNKELSDGNVAHTDGNGIIMDSFLHQQFYGGGATISVTVSGGAITGGTLVYGGVNYNPDVPLTGAGNILYVNENGASGGSFICTATSSNPGPCTAITLYTAGTGYTATTLPTSGAYLASSLVQGNVIYGNGGGCIHEFYSTNITSINNTCFGNYLDNLITNETGKAEININTGSGNTFVNNIAVATPNPANNTSGNTALADFSFSGSGATVNIVASSGSITSLTVASGGNFYFVGEFVNITQNGATLGAAQIASISGSGVVTGVTLVASGFNYTTANGLSISSPSNTGNTWSNNLGYAAANNPIYINGTSASISTTAPYYNILRVNPKFTNVSLNDYSLGNGYPVKGGGTSLYGYPSTDFSGNAIPISNIPIGAYQYLASSQQGTDHY